MSEILKNAAIIATEVHKDQKRACGQEKYIEHCKRVSGMLARDFPRYADDNTLAAAILHDTLEDCPFQSYTEVYATIANKCNPVVAAYVELLTKPRDHRDYSNMRYLNRLAISPANIQTIKALDRIDNLLSMTNVNWPMPRMVHYIEDSNKIREILFANNLTTQAELLNVQIVAATSRVATIAISQKHG